MYDFLDAHNETATFFIIGVNALSNPREFAQIVNTPRASLGVHTWTHPYLTALTNLQIIGQLGYTIDIIRDATGGKIPRYFRPPYGDSDNRVRAVAKAVFGLEAVIWNQDTGDWSLTSGGTTPEIVHASMKQWLTGPKSPGLIILEHALSEASVQCFIDAYPLIKANGWKTAPVANLLGHRDGWHDTAPPPLKEPGHVPSIAGHPTEAPIRPLNVNPTLVSLNSPSARPTHAIMAPPVNASSVNLTTVHESLVGEHVLHSSAVPPAATPSTVHILNSTNSIQHNDSAPLVNGTSVALNDTNPVHEGAIPSLNATSPSDAHEESAASVAHVNDLDWLPSDNNHTEMDPPAVNGTMHQFPERWWNSETPGTGQMNAKAINEDTGLEIVDELSTLNAAGTASSSSSSVRPQTDDGQWHPEQWDPEELGQWEGPPLYPSSVDVKDGFYDDEEKPLVKPQSVGESQLLPENDDDEAPKMHTDPVTGTLVQDLPEDPPGTNVLVVDGVQVVERRWTVLVGGQGVVVVSAQ